MQAEMVQESTTWKTCR